MSLTQLFEFISNNTIASTAITILTLIFAATMFMMPFYVFKILNRLEAVLKLQEEAKRRALKDRELRNLPRDLN